MYSGHRGAARVLADPFLANGGNLGSSDCFSTTLFPLVFDNNCRGTRSMAHSSRKGPGNCGLLPFILPKRKIYKMGFVECPLIPGPRTFGVAGSTAGDPIIAALRGYGSLIFSYRHGNYAGQPSDTDHQMGHEIGQCARPMYQSLKHQLFTPSTYSTVHPQWCS